MSNLFEIIGEGDTSADRFADGISKVARFSDPSATILGWDLVSVARAIRNWIDHGLQLDRPQEMNSTTGAKAIVSGVDFIPFAEVSGDGDVFRVHYAENDGYELSFSPTRFWSHVQRWYESRRR